MTLEQIKNRRIVLVGGHTLGCRMLTFLLDGGYNVVLCVARHEDSGKDGVFPSLWNLATNRRVSVVHPDSINSAATMAAVREASPDIVLSIINNMVFGAQWFDLMASRLGIVNVHYAPLPRYGGYWPEMWAIWNGETDFAVTLHYVALELDSGAIISQYPVSISTEETRYSLYLKCDEAAFQMIRANLHTLLAGQVRGRLQDPALRTYFKKGLPNDGFLDLSWPREKIERFIRAVSFPPFTGPKLKVGPAVYTLVSQDLPFFKPLYFAHEPVSNRRE